MLLLSPLGFKARVGSAFLRFVEVFATCSLRSTPGATDCQSLDGQHHEAAILGRVQSYF